MADWHIGQKIVCINVDGFDGQPVNHLVKSYLMLNEVYQIRDIIPDFSYVHKYTLDIRVGFRLHGIYPRPTWNSITREKVEYAFCCVRFRPLDEDETEAETSLPENIRDCLSQVNKGLTKFDDEFEKEVKKIRKKEEV